MALIPLSVIAARRACSLAFHQAISSGKLLAMNCEENSRDLRLSSSSVWCHCSYDVQACISTRLSQAGQYKAYESVTVPHHTCSSLFCLVLAEAMNQMQVQIALRHLITKASQSAVNSFALTGPTCTVALHTHIGVISLYSTCDLVTETQLGGLLTRITNTVHQA